MPRSAESHPPARGVGERKINAPSSGSLSRPALGVFMFMFLITDIEPAEVSVAFMMAWRRPAGVTRMDFMTSDLVGAVCLGALTRVRPCQTGSKRRQGRSRRVKACVCWRPAKIRHCFPLCGFLSLIVLSLLSAGLVSVLFFWGGPFWILHMAFQGFVI